MKHTSSQGETHDGERPGADRETGSAHRSCNFGAPYYERIGLLSPAERVGQRRHYPPSSAERVALIRLCQDAGFTLAEIGRLLAAWSRGRRDWGRLAERKIAELDARIADAQRAKKLITHALECPYRDLLACPNFRSALEAQLERPGSQPR